MNVQNIWELAAKAQAIRDVPNEHERRLYEAIEELRSEQVSAERKFPIQGRENYTGECVKIPWGHAEEAYKEYSARYGTQQSLERLAERMGFGVFEIIDLLVGRIHRLEKGDK